jgi:hypothetical protein
MVAAKRAGGGAGDILDHCQSSAWVRAVPRRLTDQGIHEPSVVFYDSLLSLPFIATSYSNPLAKFKHQQNFILTKIIGDNPSKKVRAVGRNYSLLVRSSGTIKRHYP